MSDTEKTKKQLISELAELRRQLAELRQSEAPCTHNEKALLENWEFYRGLVEGSPN